MVNPQLSIVLFLHIKSHHLLCNKIRESLYSRLEIKFDPIIQVVAQNDLMNTERKVDDSTNIMTTQNNRQMVKSLYKQIIYSVPNQHHKIYLVAVYVQTYCMCNKKSTVQE